MTSNNVNNKKLAPKFVFFSMEKNQKDSDDFGQIDFESQILALFDTSPLRLFAKFNNFLGSVDF